MLSPEWTPAGRTSTLARTRKDDREGGVHRLPPAGVGMSAWSSSDDLASLSSDRYV